MRRMAKNGRGWNASSNSKVSLQSNRLWLAKLQNDTLVIRMVPVTSDQAGSVPTRGQVHFSSEGFGTKMHTCRAEHQPLESPGPVFHAITSDHRSLQATLPSES